MELFQQVEERPQTARELDQFYTRDDVVDACLAFVERIIGRPEGLWVEPSAGAGAFLRKLPTPRIGIDLDPAPGAAEIVPHDFTTWRPAADAPRPVVVIGNPPFGRNASLATRFVNHAAGFADHVCFVLPRTFEKAATQDRIDPRLELVATMPMDPDSFIHDGRSYSVPCCFQIWRQLGGTRQRPRVVRDMTHPDFTIVKDEKEAHFAFQRVGVRAGLASEEGLTKSWKSHYFIRSRRDPRQLMEILNAIDWSSISERTAGNPSIGKRDLVERYQAHLDEHGIPAHEHVDGFDFGGLASG